MLQEPEGWKPKRAATGRYHPGGDLDDDEVLALLTFVTVGSVAGIGNIYMAEGCVLWRYRVWGVCVAFSVGMAAGCVVRKWCGCG
eukprot:122586-Chlamydomonas_euryale.AAC.1